MPRKIRVGVVIYKEDYNGETWYIAVEPSSGAQVQGRTIEEALRKIHEEIVKMSSAWCEGEEREAVDARVIEVELPD
jgi:predicted RNase H-like HicB family nuclease